MTSGVTAGGFWKGGFVLLVQDFTEAGHGKEKQGGLMLRTVLVAQSIELHTVLLSSYCLEFNARSVCLVTKPK